MFYLKVLYTLVALLWIGTFVQIMDPHDYAHPVLMFWTFAVGPGVLGAFLPVIFRRISRATFRRELKQSQPRYGALSRFLSPE